MDADQHTMKRYEIIDVLRGTALLLMFIYHFCFDLVFFGYARFNFNHDPFWLNFRTLIVSLFLLVMGISLQLATARGIRHRPYLKRLALLFLCAALISLISYFMYPRSMIFFGILHFITLASVLGLLFRHLYWSNLLFGAGLILLHQFYSHPLFTHPWLQWFGLMPHKPVTEDYVPLLPWFGVVLIGMFFGKLLPQYAAASRLMRWQTRHAFPRLLALGGRHSLLIYMLHQPIFFALLYLSTLFWGKS